MSKFNKIFSVLISLVLFFSLSQKVLAVTSAKDCECYTDLDKLSAVNVYKNKDKILSATCMDVGGGACDKEKALVFGKGKLEPVCFQITSAVTGVTDEQRCAQFAGEWSVQFANMLKEGEKIVKTPAKEVSTGASTISTLIQKCGLYPIPEECMDVTVFISLLLDLTNYLFTIIGALALASFVYGGFVLILSQGNPEKVKQGTGAMINAVIGLLVAFGGYVIVSYLGEIIKLKSEFGLLK